MEEESEAAEEFTAQAYLAAPQGFASGGPQTMWKRELPVQKDLFQRGLGSAYDLAETCAPLGRTEEALSYLKVAFERREANMLTGDPLFRLWR